VSLSFESLLVLLLTGGCRSDPVPRSDFESSILEPLYSSANGAISLINFEPHRLSVFFMVLGIGTLFDSHPSARTIAEHYHAFACATFSLESVVGGATCASAQAILLMTHFLFLTDRSGNERRWLLSGLCTKLIHMVGRVLPYRSSKLVEI
jgi:hypothetical protein